MANSSWNSIDFDEASGGALSAPEADYVLDYTAYHIPDSDDAVAVSCGRAPRSFTMPIQATRSIISSFQSALGSTHALTWRGPNVSVLLTAVRGVRQIAKLSDYFYAELSWDVISGGGGSGGSDALITQDADTFVTQDGDTLIWQ